MKSQNGARFKLIGAKQYLRSYSREEKFRIFSILKLPQLLFSSKYEIAKNTYLLCVRSWSWRCYSLKNTNICPFKKYFPNADFLHLFSSAYLQVRNLFTSPSPGPKKYPVLYVTFTVLMVTVLVGVATIS